MADSHVSSALDDSSNRTVIILDNGVKMREEAGTPCSTGTLGFALQKTIFSECNAAMLDYTRVFFSLKSANHKLCILRAGKVAERITHWGAADQSLQAVVDGLATSSVQSFPQTSDIAGCLRTAMQALLEPQLLLEADQTSQREASADVIGRSGKLLERSGSRISRVSQGSLSSLPLNRGLETVSLKDDRSDVQSREHRRQGGSVEQLHVSTAQSGDRQQTVARTSSGTSSVGEADPVTGRIILIQAHEDSLSLEAVQHILSEEQQAAESSTSLVSCKVTVLNVLPSGTENQNSPRLIGDPTNSAEEEAALEDGSAFGKVAVAAPLEGLALSTKEITLAAMDVGHCLRSMLHLHLDLCTIMISPLSQEKEGTGTVSIIVRRNNDLLPASGGKHWSTSSSGSVKDESDTEQKRTRLIPLTLASKSGGSASSLVPILPCAVSHASVPERPLAMPTRNLVSHLVGGGLAVLSNPLHKVPARRVAGGSRRALPATHMLTWQEGRLWLHQLQGATWLGWGEDEAVTTREGGRGARPHNATSAPPTAAPSRQDGDNTRKRVRDPKGPSAAPPQQDESHPPHHYRHLSVSIPDRNPSLPPRAETFKSPKAVDFARSYLPKPLVIPNPSSLVTEAQSILGSPAQQSAELAALLRPITRAFLGDDLDRDKASRAEKCVRKLWDCSQANEAKLLPRLADSPKARQEVYGALWKELWEMSRLFKNTSEAHHQLAQAIDFRQLPDRLQQCCQQPSAPKAIDRRKGHSHINKRRRCEEVPRDAGGRPILPIKVGPSLTILSLGRIVADRQTFHSGKYLWPVGYKSMRSYASMRQPEKRIQYCCEILDGGAAPEFRLTPEDDPNEPLVGVSATAVWTSVVKQVSTTRMDEGGKKTFANVSGPEYFGFANPTVARLLQELPGAARCDKYKMQQYEPNVPMRNRPEGESPASTTTSSASWRNADGFGASPVEDGVSISGWEHLGSDMGEDTLDMRFDLSPSSLPGLSPNDISAWMYSDGNVKAEKRPGVSSTWTGLIASAAAEGGHSSYLSGMGGQQPEVSWSGASAFQGLGFESGPAGTTEPLDELWLLTPGGEPDEEVLQGDDVSWATMFNTLPASS